jgi:hypothetical protein
MIRDFPLLVDLRWEEKGGFRLWLTASDWRAMLYQSDTVKLLRPSEDREKLVKLLHTSDVISMRLLSIEFDSELLMMSVLKWARIGAAERPQKRPSIWARA